MSPRPEPGSELFFFPKHNPPVSLRAASLEEAQEALRDQDEERLETTNPEEND